MKTRYQKLKEMLSRADRFVLCLIVSTMLHGTGYAAYLLAVRAPVESDYCEVEIEHTDTQFLDIPPELVLMDGTGSNPAPVDKKEWIEGSGDRTSGDAPPDEDGEDRVSGTGTDAEGYGFSYNADRYPEPIIDFDINRFFPAEARRASVEKRTVIVMIKVDEKGKLQGAEVVSEPAGYGFDEAALKVVSKMRFRPGIVGRKPVKMLCKLPITFTLD